MVTVGEGGEEVVVDFAVVDVPTVETWISQKSPNVI